MRDEKLFPAVFGYREYEPGEVIRARCPVCQDETFALPTYTGSQIAVLARHGDPAGVPCAGSNYTVGAEPKEAPKTPRVRRGPSQALLAARAERDKRRTEIILKRFQRRKT